MKYTSLRDIQNIIESPDIRAVSFDVFDTLLLRPVPDERTKFGLLGGMFARMKGSGLPFSAIREMAEAELRRKIIAGLIPEEDVLIGQIYEVIRSRFLVDSEIAERMMEAEIALEHRLCRQRKSGKKLYDAARASGKKVIITTDIYLTGDQVSALLRENGFDGYDLLLVSSEEGKRKATGSLYREMIERTGLPASEILHIGDNPESDVRLAKEAGLRAVHLPSTMSAFERYGCASQVRELCRDLTDWECASREPGIAVSRKMAADYYFDDPFRPFDPASAYNADARFAGYAALGLQILAVVRWIAENIGRDGAKKMVFLSRDGYLPMRAYELYREIHPELPPCGYLYCSRISLLPWMINSPGDLFGLPVDIGRYNPEKLLGILRFCSAPDAADRVKKVLPCGEKKFTGASFAAFISAFIESAYDSKTHEKSRERVKKYLLQDSPAGLEDGTAVFDLGYSGRTALAMRDAAGKDIVFYYFQGNGEGFLRTRAENGLTIRSFLDFSPYMEATMREYSYLEAAPSCVGYTEDAAPVFDEGPADGYRDSAAAMQEGALHFLKDFLDTFSGYEEGTVFRYHNAALPFEAFLRFCSGPDREIYRNVVIDDELWGGRRNIDLNSLRDARLRKMPEYTRRTDT